MLAIVFLPFAILTILGVIWLAKGREWKARKGKFPPSRDTYRPGDFG